MAKPVYTKERAQWILDNAEAKTYKDVNEFLDIFNAKFGLNQTLGSMSTYLNKHHISVKTTHMKFTDEMSKWIVDNASLGIFKNYKHFTEVFNAVHGTNVTTAAMTTHLSRIKVSVSTPANTDHYTEEENKWIIDNYANYNNDWVTFARDFNEQFGRTDMTNCRLAKHCERRLKIHKPKEKKGQVNRGTFVKGNKSGSTTRQCPVGTIRTYSTGKSKSPWIKVKLCEGDSGLLLENHHCHNMKRPWWMPLKDKVWIDNYGDIPEGYCVTVLDKDQFNCNIENLALIDRRGTGIMASHDWWSDNSKFTQIAIDWCNLYMTAKDNNVI